VVESAAAVSPEPVPTGLSLVDGLAALSAPTVMDYVGAASIYVRSARSLSGNQKKAAQIRLSAALGRVLLLELRQRLPTIGVNATSGERDVSGALRVAKVDVSEMHRLDGLRLAVELKPVNLAVGRAIWNRFGDIRMTAVNLHLKFPFAVVGGILTFPTYEEDLKAGQIGRRSTTHLIARAITRLERAGGRRTEGDAPHLLEGVGVLVYDPDTAQLDDELPPETSPLQWDHFITDLVTAYSARFE
jgi:hypothetical protein